MPYSIRKQKCKQSDGDAGSYTLSYTDKKGKGHSACHTSRKKARGQIAAIEGPYEGVHATEPNLVDNDELNSLYENILQRILVEVSENAINSALKQIPGLENAHVNKRQNHIRVHDDNVTNADDSTKERYSKEIGLAVYSMKDPQAKNMGMDQNISRTYPYFRVSDASTGAQFNIVFGGTKLAGQRGKGYQYEEDVLKQLTNLGLEANGGSNVETDIHVYAPAIKKNIKIETKAFGAVFGQPTLLYDYRYSLFKPATRSKSPEAADLACNILNDRSNSSAELVHRWMDDIRKLWNSTNPSKTITSEYSTQISIIDYDEILKPTLTQNKKSMISEPVQANSDVIVDYYSTHKDADYIQLSQKGLFHFAAKGDILKVGTISFEEAAINLQATIRVQLSSSGNNKVLRAQFEMPIDNMPNSTISLDNNQDIARFAKACQTPQVQIENIRARISRNELKYLKNIIWELARHAK